MITAPPPVLALPAPPLEKYLALEPPIVEYPSNNRTLWPDLRAIDSMPPVTLIPSCESSRSCEYVSTTKINLTPERVSDSILSPKPSRSVDCLPSLHWKQVKSPDKKGIKIFPDFLNIKKAIKKSQCKQEKSKKFNENDQASKSE